VGTSPPQDTCRLDEDEERAWLAFASLTTRLPAVLDTQLQRDAGISHFEYIVMARLSTAPDRTLRMSVLATLAEGSLPRLSQAVGRLEKRGWIRRTPDPADGRYTLAILTAAGAAKLVETAPGHVETVRRYVFDQLSRTQVRQLAAIGERLLHALPPDETWPTEMPSDRRAQRAHARA
jgi:DNA-binding MarR family transcriptional regulator